MWKNSTHLCFLLMEKRKSRIKDLWAERRKQGKTRPTCGDDEWFYQYVLCMLCIGSSVAQWLGRLPWDPEIPGSRPALTTRWICSWQSPVQLPSCQLGFLTVVVVFPRFRCVSLALKSPYGERSIKYVLYCIASCVFLLILRYTFLLQISLFHGRWRPVWNTRPS